MPPVILAYTTRYLAPCWWVGPAGLVLSLLVVPVLRLRHNVLRNPFDLSLSARFAWAPGWGMAAIAFTGLCLLAAPLVHPALAAYWAPSAWLGLRFTLDLELLAMLPVLGISLVLIGALGVIRAWLWDYQLRYLAWRWRLNATRRH